MEKPKYIDTKTGRVVKAITLESIHGWKKLQKHTGFSDKELNYHLSRLYNDNVIVRQNKEYYIVPELERQYQRHYQQAESSKNKARYKPKKVINIKSTLLIVILFLSIIANLHYVSTLNQVRTENNQLYNEIDTLTSIINQLQNTLTDYESTVNSLNDQIINLNNQISILESEINTPEQERGTENYETQIDQDYNIITSTSTPTTLTPWINAYSTASRVIDGDTFELTNGQRVRLADIDAPEATESGFYSRKETLTSWIQGKRVYLDIDNIHGTDQYDRLVTVVYVAFDSGYINVNHELVSNGYAEISNYDNEFDPTDWGTTQSIYYGSAEEYTIESTESSSSSSSDSSSDPSSQSGPFWGSINSDIYHKPSCYWAKKISSSNLRVFSSRTEAENAGYRPCKVCNP